MGYRRKRKATSPEAELTSRHCSREAAKKGRLDEGSRRVSRQGAKDAKEDVFFAAFAPWRETSSYWLWGLVHRPASHHRRGGGVVIRI